MKGLVLHIGSKNYSSWSLRPWLGLKAAGLAFTEHVIRLRQDDTKDRIAKVSPSGKVPCLDHDGLLIWDSLAILEYAAELAPQAGLWPKDAKARALARAVSAEMHSGFQALRQNMPMDIWGSFPGQGMTPEVAADVARIQALWAECRARFGKDGPYLFGKYSIADAMYAPVATRFRTYGVTMDSTAKAYTDTLWALPAMQEWIEGARREQGV